MIEALSDKLHQDAAGIWRAGAAEVVSYAAEGHTECFQLEDRSFWFRHRNDCIAAMIARHRFTGTMLDIGGGNGYVARRLAHEGHRVVLLEPGEVGARNARGARGLEHVVCATLDQAGFRAGSFGAVGLFDVIEHVELDRAFLVSASEVLAPAGRLYLTVPCHEWLWSDADVVAGHFRRHTRATLEALLDGLFRIDYLSGFFRPLLLPQYLLRALPHRLGLGRSRGLIAPEAEHGAGQGMAARVVAVLLRREHARLTHGHEYGIELSPSCLVAATRL